MRSRPLYLPKGIRVPAIFNKTSGSGVAFSIIRFLVGRSNGLRLLLCPDLCAARNLFLNGFPGVGREKRLFETINHLVEHAVRHRKSELIGFEELAGRGVPAAKHGPLLSLRKVFSRPSDEAGAGRAPRRGDDFRVVGDKSGQLMKAG